MLNSFYRCQDHFMYQLVCQNNFHVAKFSVFLELGMYDYGRELQFRSLLFVFAFGPFFMLAISLLHKSSITETGFIPEIYSTSPKYAFLFLYVSKLKNRGFQNFDCLFQSGLNFATLNNQVYFLCTGQSFQILLIFINTLLQACCFY